MADGWRDRLAGERLAGGILFALVGVACLLPLGWMVVTLASHPQVWHELRPTAPRMQLLGRTVGYNAIAAAMAVILALPAALVIGRGRSWLARTGIVLLPVALVVPSLSYMYGWFQFFRLIGVFFVPASWPDVLRCVWTLAAWLWPLPAVVIGLSLRMLDSQVQQQAILDGAMWRITGRLLAPAVLVSLALVLVLAMQEFTVYEKSGISVVATEVRTIFEMGSLSMNNPDAIVAVQGGSGLEDENQQRRAAAALATAVPMLLIVVLLAAGAFWGARRMLHAGDSVDAANWPHTLDAPHWAAVATLVIVGGTIGVPTASMLLSISPHRWQTDSEGHGFVMRVWLWARPEVLGSLLYGGLTALGAIFIGVMAVVRRSKWLLVAAFALFLVGGEILAIANIRLYNRVAPWPLSEIRFSGRDPLALVYNNAPVMVVAYLGRFGWIALLAGLLTWSGVFREVRDLAAVDGAGPWRTAMAAVLPLAWPILLAGAILVMILSMTEVPASVLLAPQRPRMLVPTLMGWVHMLRYDDMLEGSLLLMAVVLALGLACAGLVWMGMRLGGVLRKIVPAGLALLMLAGCDDGERPQAVWCQTGPALGQLIYPRGITYSLKDDCFFVVDRTARIQRIEKDGSASLQWRMPDYTAGKPVGLSVGPDGNVYVPDTHYGRIMVYSPKGELLRQWGTFGTGPGQFIYPTDVAFDKAGNVYVSEYGDNDRIQVFDPAGKLLRSFGRPGMGDGEFSRPESLVVDGDLVYVSDSCNHRISVLKTDGTFVRHIGGIGSGLGELRFPYGLDQDEKHLIVTEFGNNRVQIIDKASGKGVKVWGKSGREPGQLAYPWAAAVDKRGRVVVVDSGNNRLQVFGM